MGEEKKRKFKKIKIRKKIRKDNIKMDVDKFSHIRYFLLKLFFGPFKKLSDI